jgi:P2-related tail formation protein
MSQKIYDLLPSVYREKDKEEGGQALESLLIVLEEQLNRVELGIEQMYNNWFTQTCDAAILPYIGELFGLPVTKNAVITSSNLRRQVINSIRYSRRKGVPWALAQLGEDISQWPCRVVEAFTLIGATQNVSNIMLNRGGLARVSDLLMMQRLNTPFDQTAHTVDVRLINRPNSTAAPDRGIYNTDNVPIYTWPTQIQTVNNARAFEHNNPLQFSFSPLGLNIQLYNKPVPKTNPSAAAYVQGTEENYPVALSTVLVNNDLLQHVWSQSRSLPSQNGNTLSDNGSFDWINDNAILNNFGRLPSKRRTVSPTCKTTSSSTCQFYGEHRAFFIRYKKNTEIGFTDLQSHEFICSDLLDWVFPSLPEHSAIKVAIDVSLGRILFREEKHTDSDNDNDSEQEKSPNYEVLVNYNVGTSINIGGGSYNRNDTLAAPGPRNFTMEVSKQNCFELNLLPEYLEPRKYKVTLTNNVNTFDLTVIGNAYVAPVLNVEGLTLANVAKTLEQSTLLAVPEENKEKAKRTTPASWPQYWLDQSVALTAQLLLPAPNMLILPANCFDSKKTEDQDFVQTFNHYFIFALTPKAPDGFYKIHVSPNPSDKTEDEKKSDDTIDETKNDTTINSITLSIAYAAVKSQVNKAQIEFEDVAPENIKKMLDGEAQGWFTVISATQAAFDATTTPFTLELETPIENSAIKLLPNGQYTHWPPAYKDKMRKTLILETTAAHDSHGAYQVSVNQHKQTFDLNVSYEIDADVLIQAPARVYNHLTLNVLDDALQRPCCLAVKQLPNDGMIPTCSPCVLTVREQDTKPVSSTDSKQVAAMAFTLSSYTPSLQEAVNQWNDALKLAATDAAPKSQFRGLIRVLDNAVYAETMDEFRISEGNELIIEAANGVCPMITATSTQQDTTDDQDLPALKIKVTGQKYGSLQFNGFHFSGNVYLHSLSRISFVHCTLPSNPNDISQVSCKTAKVSVLEGSQKSEIAFSFCFIGSLEMPSFQVNALLISDSIVNGGNVIGQQNNFAIIGKNLQLCDYDHDYACPAKIERSTIFGACKISQLTASDCLFTDPITVCDQQRGYIRYSYFPHGSITPVCYQCQPAQDEPAPQSTAQGQWMVKTPSPVFQSTRWGTIGYGRLSQMCPEQIREGAESGRQMGAFNRMQPPGMLKAFQSTVQNNAPAGLQVAIFLED